MKRGNELKPVTKKQKVFIYTDTTFELSHENVFVSGVYKNVTEFRKDNPGMRPLINYDADHLVEVLAKQLGFKLVKNKNKR